MVADEQRAERRRAVALAREPPADHQLLAPAHLELAPGARPAADLVGAVGALGDQPLEATVRDGRQQRGSRSQLGLGDRPRRALLDEPAEQALSFEVGHRRDVDAIEPEDVEHGVDHGLSGGPLGCGHRVAGVHAVLQEAEVGPTIGGERDDLAVEDDPVDPQARGQWRQLGEADGGVVAVRRGQTQLAAVAERDGSHAIPLHLVGPAGVVGGRRPGRRPHRLDRPGHRRFRRRHETGRWGGRPGCGSSR